MRFKQLQQWLDWQLSLHDKAIDLGLERVASVWQKFSPAFDNTFVITVAGTNGKGSSVAMLEAILLSAGYRVGCYTSPHLIEYNERIRIDGEAVDDDQICQAFEAIDQARKDTTLSYFEFGTLAALYCFKQHQCDCIVLEVGLGGRLDAVNIIDADAALITAIGIDHQDWLGDNREDIGREKAGIFRQQQLAVFSGKDIPASVVQTATNQETSLWIAGQHYQMKQTAESWDLHSPQGNRHALPYPALRGEHQLENAAGVVALLQACRTTLPVSSEAIRNGLLEARLYGRFQVMQWALGDVAEIGDIGETGDIREGEQGLCQVVADVAHNPQSMASLAENLRRFVIKGQLIAIVGMLRDKDSLESLKLLHPHVDRWILVSTQGERGMSAEVLQKHLLELDDASLSETCNNLAQARQSALQYLVNDDTLLVTGSFHIVGDFLALEKKHQLTGDFEY